MNFDFSEFFDNAGEKAQAALDDLIKVGVPAVEVAAQQWGIDVLQGMQKESQANLNTAIKDVQANPSSPGSFGAAIKTSVQGTFLEVYGLHIVIGVVVLIGVGFALRGK